MFIVVILFDLILSFSISYCFNFLVFILVIEQINDHIYMYYSFSYYILDLYS